MSITLATAAINNEMYVGTPNFPMIYQVADYYIVVYDGRCNLWTISKQTPLSYLYRKKVELDTTLAIYTA